MVLPEILAKANPRNNKVSTTKEKGKKDMLGQYLKEDFIQCGAEASDWREAIQVASVPLVNAGLVGDSYVERTIQKIEELGPYIVLTKGVAVAHARPKTDVKEDCISLATLKHPVEFGHKTNDPVSIVFILAAKDDNGHIGAIMEVAQKLCEDGIKEKLALAQSASDIFQLVVEVPVR